MIAAHQHVVPEEPHFSCSSRQHESEQEIYGMRRDLYFPALASTFPFDSEYYNNLASLQYFPSNSYNRQENYQSSCTPYSPFVTFGSDHRGKI